MTPLNPSHQEVRQPVRIGTLVEDLGDAVAFQGDPASEFRGFSVRSNRGAVKDRYFLVADATWRSRLRRRYLAEDVTAEDKIREAIANGASGVICPRDMQGAESLVGQNVIFTASTFEVMARIAEVVQRYLNRQKITAVTGSAGKSTTAAMVVHALTAADVGRVYAQAGNRNLATQVLPQLSRADRSRHTVLEVAGSAFPVFKEIDFAVSPHVAILTAISEAHLDYLHDLESVARIKSDLFLRPPEGGTAVVNIDTPHADIAVQRAIDEGQRLVTYGEGLDADIRLVSYDAATHRVVAMVEDERFEYSLCAPGKHMAMNSLAVIATLRAYGVFYWREGIRALSTFEPLDGRGIAAEVRLSTGAVITLVDESYNSNPASIRASLEMLAAWSDTENRRKVAILGDVLELGDRADSIHRDLAEPVLAAGLDEVHLFGEHMRTLFDELRGRHSSVHHWTDLDAMKDGVLPLLRENDLVLTKASGATGLKQFVRSLRNQS